MRGYNIKKDCAIEDNGRVSGVGLLLKLRDYTTVSLEKVVYSNLFVIINKVKLKI